jgi:hypothetical protein
MFIAFVLGDKLALRSAMYNITWHVAPDGANYYLVALGYKHAAPPEQRQVSQVCGCRRGSQAHAQS